MQRLLLRLASFMLKVEDVWRRFTSRRVGVAGLLAIILVVGIFGVFGVARAQEGDLGIVGRFFLFVAAVALGFAAMLGQLIVLLLDVIIIPLMQYNGFASSPVVNAGWAIIRDTVNMFFVIVLIVIAFATIFGGRVGQKTVVWQQQVPRLMIFALVINFSKTLCGLMIDIGQVIMLTFANALKDIAGGNFIQLFGLNDIMSISTKSDLMEGVANSTGSEAAQAFDWAAAGVMALLMMIIVTTTVVILGVILAYRIVMLWILVTISPLAWFMGGASGVFDSKAYADWWSNFKCYITVGPVLTFFMWLTLAVAGSGNIALTDSGFSTTAAADESGAGDVASTNPANSLLGAFEVSRMTSFIIGIAMMYAGFNAAQTACSAASQGGFVTRQIGTARGSGAAAAGVGALIAARGARGAGRLGRSVAGDLGYGLNKVQKRYTGLDLSKTGRAEMYRNVAKRTGSKALAGTLGGWAEQLEKEHAEEVKTAGAPLADKDLDTRLAFVMAAARSGKPMLPDEINKVVSTLGGLFKNKKARKKLEEEGMLGQLMHEYGTELHAAGKGDHELHEALEDLENTRPDIAIHGEGDTEPARRADYLRKLAKQLDNQENISKLDAEALQNDDVKNILKTVQSGKVDKDGNSINAFDYIAKGMAGNAKQKALVGEPPQSVFQMREQINVDGSFANSYAEESFKGLVGRDPTQIGSISDATLRANNGNNAVTRAAGASLSREGMAEMFERYTTATPEQRVSMQGDMDKIARVLDYNIAWSANPERYQRMKTYFDSTRRRVESVTGGAPAGTDRAAALERERVAQQAQAQHQADVEAEAATAQQLQEQQRLAEEAERQAEEAARRQERNNAVQSQIASIQARLDREMDLNVRRQLKQQLEDLRRQLS